MDRRGETRIPCDTPVRVTVLSSPPQQFEAILVNVSGRGARLRVPQRLNCDDAIRIDLDDAMLLGEVCYCANDGDAFGIGVQLEHSLMAMAEIARLRDRILEESTSAPRAAQRA